MISFLVVPALALNVLLVGGYALRRRRWPALIFGALLLLNVPYALSTYGLRNAAPSDPGELKVVSYNVKMFDRQSMPSLTHEGVVGAQIDWLRSLDADIICLQEFYSFSGEEVYNTLEKLRRAGYPHVAFHPHVISWSGKVPHYYGVIILSRHPIARSGEVAVKTYGSNQIIFADVVTPVDTVRCFGVHLQSYNVRSEQERNTWQHLYERFREGFSKRSVQVDVLLAQIERSPHPVMVCGDLNDTPYSYTYARLNGRLDDAFDAGGAGFGFTYPSARPLVRIDNIFTDPVFECVRWEVTDRPDFSDHLPVTATLRWQARPAALSDADSPTARPR
ncbi:MAG: endonuclease/exonuclease/phosphatase family protein [Catalinimonas sp.]